MQPVHPAASSEPASQRARHAHSHVLRTCEQRGNAAAAAAVGNKFLELPEEQKEKSSLKKI